MSGPGQGHPPGLLGRIACKLGFHPCTTNSDDSGVWGECVRCHKRFGFVDRATLRRYSDAEYAQSLATSRSQHEGASS